MVIFFARPEVMCDLVTLANFKQDDPTGASAHGIQVQLYRELTMVQTAEGRSLGCEGHVRPLCPCLCPLDNHTMAFPMKKFVRVIQCMIESFLIHKYLRKGKNEEERSAAPFGKT